MLTLDLPWPPRELSPNARIHHMAKAKATKVYRESVYWLSKKARNFSCFADDCQARTADFDTVLVTLTFHPPDRRRRDLDGMFSSMKAALDGLADSLCVNDNRFEFRLRRAEPIKGGKVTVEIS